VSNDLHARAKLDARFGEGLRIGWHDARTNWEDGHGHQRRRGSPKGVLVSTIASSMNSCLPTTTCAQRETLVCHWRSQSVS